MAFQASPAEGLAVCAGADKLAVSRVRTKRTLWLGTVPLWATRGLREPQLTK